MVRDLLAQGHSLLSSAHELLDLLQVVFGAVVLVLLDDLNVGTAVVLPDMLDEVGAITDRLSLQRVNEGTVTLVEAV